MASEPTALQVIAGAAQCPAYSPERIKALLEHLRMNEKAFALLMNVTPTTVRLWTTGAARPCGVAQRLMQLYDAEPQIIEKVIHTIETKEGAGI